MAIFAFKKKMLSTAVAAAMLSGMVISNNASAIHLAEDGIGQVLLAPYYTVENVYKTKFAIVNTRNDMAVKAKVVVRSKAHSTEVLDFICYLTPTDVCRFEIKMVNGQAHLYSDDDSVRSSFSPVKFGSQEPALKMLFDDRMLGVDKADINEVGHVEIIGVYAASGVVVTPEGPVAIVKGMSKFDLRKVFDTPRVYDPDYPAVPYLELFNTPEANLGTAIRSSEPSLVRLTGSVEIVKEDNTDRMGYNIPALAGYYGTHYGQNVDTRVISNPKYDATVAKETAVGTNFSGASGTGDNILDIEKALATTELTGTYGNDAINKTNLIVTFPTKYKHRAKHVCNNVLLTAAEYRDALYTPPFADNGSVKYKLHSYDNQENSQETGDIWSGGSTPESFLFNEVNYVMPNWPYASGWYEMELIATQDAGYDVCGYLGVPALALSHKWMSVGGNVVNSMLTPVSAP